MGQYYKAMVIGDHNKRYVLSSWDYDNGSKLMEHSYFTNEFVGAVDSLLLEHPMRVAWIGDYSDDVYGDPYEKQMPHDKFMSYYNACWGKNQKPNFIVPAENIQDIQGMYLVNHTKKYVIDLNEYYEQNKWPEKWMDYKTHTEMSSMYCIHPLPLLTACGNGRGGGDYRGKFHDYSEVGTWAFDKLEYRHDKPEGYTEVMYSFKED